MIAGVVAVIVGVLVCGPARGQMDQAVEGVRVSGDAPEASGYRIERVLGGLNHPWAMVWLPGGGVGDMLITERRGTLRLVRDGELVRRPIDGLPAIFAAGQGGLMEVALHPRFEENRVVYLAYSSGNRRSNRTVLGAGRLSQDGTALEDFEELFAVAESKSGGQHFGVRIVFLPDETMLLAIGDGGNPPTRYEGKFIREQSQNKGAHLGKVLRLTDRGEPAAGNPFADDAAAAAEVFSLGHRNIQGMARDPETGTIWATEHGARGGDELNVIRAGVNYGWPTVTYSREYHGPRISDEVAGPGFEDPVIAWTPSKAPSGLCFYTGDAFEDWKGDLFSGALVLRHIRHIDLEDGEVVGETKIPTEGRVRDVRQGPDGMIYFITDESRGELLRLVPAA